MKKKQIAWMGVGILLASLMALAPVLAEDPPLLSGKVTDARGNPVSGAEVVALHVAANREFRTRTDKEGKYAFRAIPPGLYTIRVEVAGMKAVRETGVQVDAGKAATVDFLIDLDSKVVIPSKLLAELAEGKKSSAAVLGGVVGGVLGGVTEAEAMYRTAVPGRFPHLPADFNTEEYDRIYENKFLPALQNPLSTFSIDVDTASYANIRRFLNENRFPYKDAVRIEEMINYFSYDYPQPEGRHPFSVYAEISACPWNPGHRLIHIGLQGKKLAAEKLPPSNLVFLLDVSGSMRPPNKLPLLQKAFKLLVSELGANDRVSIVVYAGAAGLVLPSTAASQKDTILAAVDRLQAGGSTAGGAGIQLAYKTAEKNFIRGGNNRVILATDGDFNVGVSSTSELVRMIEDYREKKIFLTVLGFGMGNYKDGRMEQLADKGNGNYHYIDNLMEAKKVFVDDMRGTLFTIAKDVKIQVEFNPAKVKAYRLIGYENRLLDKEDFSDDTKDAGELGAGHTVTALYEVIPYGSEEEIPGTEDLKYQETRISPEAFKSREILTVKLRYKEPDGDKSKLILHPLEDRAVPLASASQNFKFSAAVASFGMLLRDSPYKGKSTYESVLKLAKEGRGKDSYGYRAEFIRIVEKCALLENLGTGRN